jgi:exodeoxyribonuclease-5
MKLTLEQSKVYDQILKFFKSYEPGYRVLTGYAGVGKTTVISKVIEELESSGFRVAVMAYTGRATSVLKNKGVKASTIHSMIYYPIIFNGNVIRFDKKINNPDKRADLDKFDCFIVDEASMINQEIFKDLMELENPILFVGDNAQLEPIEKNKSNFSLFDNITWQLKHIHRQALENPIIALSQQIRLTGRFDKSLADDKHLIFRDKREVMSSKHLKAEGFKYDIILCGLNKTRLKLNNKFRSLGNHTSDHAEVHEPIICLRNRLLNGRQFYNGERYRVIDRNVVDLEKYLREIAKYSNVIDDSKIYTYTLRSLDTDDDNTYEVNIPNTSFDEVEPKAKGLGYFTFAYACTVHKSQGSEWRNVGFVREDVSYFCDQRAFDYTAITRAREHITIYL